MTKSTGFEKILVISILICLIILIHTGFSLGAEHKDSISTPKIKSIESVDEEYIKIKWSKVANVTGYQIYRSTSKNGTYKKIATVKASKRSYNDKFVKIDKKYYYKIRAYVKSNGKNRFGKFGGKKSGMLVKVTDVVIPVYWQNAADEAITKVKAKQKLSGSEYTNFVLFSDMHYVGREGAINYTDELGNLSAYIMDYCNIPFAVMAGDTAESDCATTEKYILEDIEKARKVLSPIGEERLLHIRGNHDDVWGEANGIYYVNKIAPNKIWDSFHRTEKVDYRRVYGGDCTYFYVDDIQQKTRFICLNAHYYEGPEITSGLSKHMTSGFGAEQLDWLEKAALNVKNDFDVVIFTHIPPTASTINGRNYYLSQYNDGVAFRNILVSSDANIIGMFCGHTHVDSIVEDDLPFPIITIRCASNLDYDTDVYPKGTRVLGSDNETALDIVTIDKKHKKIHLTRLGLGNDRVCSYGEAK